MGNTCKHYLGIERGHEDRPGDGEELQLLVIPRRQRIAQGRLRYKREGSTLQ